MGAAGRVRRARRRPGSAAEGHGQVVLLSGPAGIGKTSLVRAFLRSASGRARILLGACEDLVASRTLGRCATRRRAARCRWRPREALELARRASPITYVHPGAPPFHIAHGDADRFVPAAQSRQLAERLRGAGVPVEFTEVPGADHLWMNAPDPEAIFDAAVGFVRRVTARPTSCPNR